MAKCVEDVKDVAGGCEKVLYLVIEVVCGLKFCGVMLFNFVVEFIVRDVDGMLAGDVTVAFGVCFELCFDLFFVDIVVGDLVKCVVSLVKKLFC